MHLDETAPKKGLDSMTLSLPDFADWREQSQSFAAMAAYAEDSFTLSGTDKAERTSRARASRQISFLCSASPPRKGGISSLRKTRRARRQ